MVHLARAAPDGIEQRSRYWIGHDAKLRLFGSTLSVDKLGVALGTQRRMAGVRVAYEQLLHDQIEFTHLATFLPELWVEARRSRERRCRTSRRVRNAVEYFTPKRSNKVAPR